MHQKTAPAEAADTARKQEILKLHQIFEDLQSPPVHKLVEVTKKRLENATPDENGLLVPQAKHQDPYGGDIKRRSNRAQKLRDEAASWLNSMRKWVQEESPSNINSALRLKADFTWQNIRYVVLARHFAHFLSNLDLTDAAYATWIQFYDALNRLHSEDRPKTLSSLFDTLNEYMSHKIAKGYELDNLDSYHLRNLSYRIRPSAAE